ncbi:hypothetical protein NQ317_003145 [Molorchus minor]|uniref:Endonuclease/exonuclease/phosphatase domain-containing protein n=1 Tax=Molorchus minor TaxID=1323400 RepID=A0ABQ9JZA8_9CUCU|nr:hypothetical protein NQ317_003145 [Molorchus minor]
MNEGQQDLAYFRDFENGDQCELQFLINTDIPGIGLVKEEIKSVRRRTDTISSLIQHTKNKLQLLLNNKTENKENREVEIVVSLKRGDKPCKDDLVLKNFIESLVNTPNVILKVFDQEYKVIRNAPQVRQLQLPPILYANFSIQPNKFRREKSVAIFWYKSKDKITWDCIGKEFTQLLTEDHLNHYIKLVCVPGHSGLKGPKAEVISESVVELVGDLPVCPFEKRHQYTRTKLSRSEFRVVSYNILSERYTIDSDNYSYCTPRALAIDYRKQLIVKELIGYNADIICLQEVDNKQYTTYFKPNFKALNYGSVYHRKGNRIPEGLCCIFNKSRYQLVESKHIVLREEVDRHKIFSPVWNMIKKNEDLKAEFLKQYTSLQVSIFKVKSFNRYIIVGNTHLYYHPDANHIRLLQVTMATAYLCMLKRRYLKDSGDVSVIFCGDFNSEPEKSLFPFMLEGKIHPSHKDCLKILENGKALLYHEFMFSSAWVRPNTQTIPQTIRAVPLTGEEVLSQHEGLPNEIFPSDHLALVVDLAFKV